MLGVLLVPVVERDTVIPSVDDDRPDLVKRQLPLPDLCRVAPRLPLRAGARRFDDALRV